MRQLIRKPRDGDDRDDGGFTLIELLIVVIILGVLAALVLLAIGNARKDSVANTCKTSLRALKLSAEAVHTKTGDYPEKSGLKATVNGVPNTIVNRGAELIAGYTDPDNGALMKEYPLSADYSIVYTGDGELKVFPASATDDDGMFTGTLTGPAKTPAVTCSTL